MWPSPLSPPASFRLTAGSDVAQISTTLASDVTTASASGMLACELHRDWKPREHPIHRCQRRSQAAVAPRDGLLGRAAVQHRLCARTPLGGGSGAQRNVIHQLMDFGGRPFFPADCAGDYR